MPFSTSSQPRSRQLPSSALPSTTIICELPLPLHLSSQCGQKLDTHVSQPQSFSLMPEGNRNIRKSKAQSSAGYRPSSPA